MKWLALLIGIGLSITLGMMVFDAGKKAALRECPSAQQGERLLSSQQMPSGLLCTYAGGWNGYGHNIIVRKR